MKKIFFTILACTSAFGMFSMVSSTFADEVAFPVPVCVAHRGFSDEYPENTVIAMEKAIETGADGNEMDIRLSSDGILFLNHDGNLKRYTGEDINPCTLTVAELRKRDVGSFKGEQFKGEPVAMFEECIAMHVGKHTVPVVELKQGGIEAQTLEILQKYDMVETSVIIAFSATACKKMRELNKDIFIAWLCVCDKDETPEVYAQRIIRTCADCKINAVDMEHHSITPDLVKTLHDAGLTVMCWTVDDADRMRACLDAGVDSVTTNRPDVLLKVLGR